MPEMEVKTFPMQIRSVSEEEGEFTGYAAVFGNRDSYGDVIEPGAFAESIAAKTDGVPVLWQHDPWEPIGVSAELAEDERGLRVKARVSKVAQRGREALHLMGMGALTGLSIGFRVLEREIDAGTRRLTKIDLWEFSPVTWPANELALVTGVKSLLSPQQVRALLDGQSAPAGPDGPSADQRRATVRALITDLQGGEPS